MQWRKKRLHPLRTVTRSSPTHHFHYLTPTPRARNNPWTSRIGRHKQQRRHRPPQAHRRRRNKRAGAHFQRPPNSPPSSSDLRRFLICVKHSITKIFWANVPHREGGGGDTAATGTFRPSPARAALQPRRPGLPFNAGHRCSTTRYNLCILRSSRLPASSQSPVVDYPPRYRLFLAYEDRSFFTKARLYPLGRLAPTARPL